jgi:crotonobetainyl-CoA:carnitine CoA-transferase CaiB-like acyl-CoA transferase
MVQTLKGVRVIEQGTFITGPVAGMLLGDLGADVIKVEQPVTGDPFRADKGGLYSARYQAYNRNKRSIALNTKTAVDLEIFDDLISSADVYIQNFRPGTAEKLGAGEDRLRKLNSKLIYCSISGFGATGPGSKRPSYDTVAQAASGFLHLMINPDKPRVVGPAIADAMTGFYAAYGVLGALHERNRTGVGRKVEVSMLEAMCHFNSESFAHYFSDGEVTGPYTRPRASQAHVMKCSDGKWIALHMSSPDKFWQSLVQAIERPALFEDPRFTDWHARIANQDDLIVVLREVFKQRPRDEWCRRLEERDVPYASVYDSSEALEDPQAKHLQIEVHAQHPTMGEFRTVRCPITYDGERSLSLIAPPTLDQHREEILRGLGRSVHKTETTSPAAK